MDDWDCFIELVPLFKGNLQLLESSHHRGEEKNGDDANLERLLGKLPKVLAKGPDRDLARSLEGEFLGRQKEHQCRKSGDAEHVDEEQSDGDDRTKDLQEGQRRQPERKEANDVGGDGDHQRNRREHGALSNGSSTGFPVEVPERDTSRGVSGFLFLEFFPNTKNDV